MINPIFPHRAKLYHTWLIFGGVAVLATMPHHAIQAESLKIGALLPVTGALETFGKSSKNGINLALEEINGAGGIFGAPLEIVFRDTKSNPAAGVEAANNLVNSEKVHAFVGPLSSGVTIPVARAITGREGLPVISSASTAPAISDVVDGDFLFRTVPTDAKQGLALARLAKSKGVTSLSIIYRNDPYGRGLARAFADNFGGTINHSLPYSGRQKNNRTLLRNAAVGKPQRLLLISNPGDGAVLLKQAIRGKYFRKFLFADGMKSRSLIKAIGAKHLNGSFGTAPSANGPASEKFKSRYQAKFNREPETPFIDSAYDATMILALAAVKAGKSDPNALRDAIRKIANPPGTRIVPGEFEKAAALLKAGEAIDYDGAAGPQDFDAKGDVAGTYRHWEITKGKIVSKEIIKLEK